MKRITLILSLLLVFIAQGFAQQKVEGHVKNSEGVTLPGVSVMIKGTTYGTVTNMDGFYTMDNVTADATLVFSFIGMISEEIPVGGQAIINMVLVEDIMNLDEVVVVGYGSVKRANLTGAVADIKAEKLEDVPAGDLATTLQGRLAGVKVSMASGKPGVDASIKIRTSSSFGGMIENTLYVIDGIVYDNNSYDGGLSVGAERFNQLDPSEIESISILKDASAAVYGARSTAGVVLVKTKQGKEGKMTINYSNSYGISVATSLPDMLSAYEHASMMNYIYENDDLANPQPNRYDYYAEDELEAFKGLNYNWVDKVWKKRPITNKQTLNLSGGSEKVTYFVGGSYYKEAGNLDNLEANKYTFRSNVKAKVTNRLTARVSVSMGIKKKTEPYYSGEKGGYALRNTFKRLVTAPKWIPPTIDEMPVANDMDIYQPYGLLESGSYKSEASNNSSLTGALDYDIPGIEGLTTSVQYSYNTSNNSYKQYAEDYTVYEFLKEGTNRHIISNELREEKELSNNAGWQEGYGYSKSYQFNARIDYKKTIGAHKISAAFIYEQNEAENYGGFIRRSGMQVPDVDQLWAFGTAGMEANSSPHESGRLGYIGRLNYSFADKYIIEGTLRADASANFHPDHRLGYFPAVSAGWIISEEDFFKNNIAFVSFLKIRGAAGLTGNDNIRPYQFKPSFSGNNTGAIFGTQLSNSITIDNNGLYNPSATWAKSGNYNLGIDSRLYQGKIDIGIDMFYRLTYDLLDKRRSSKPFSTGIEDPPNENYGKMYAKGLEISAGFKDKLYGQIDYNIDANFSWTKHRVVIRDQNPAVIGRWDDQLLNDPSNQPGYICKGIIRTEEDLANCGYTEVNEKPVEIGQLWYQDIRGENYSEGPDGVIDKFDQTTIAEYTTPPFNYGFSFGATWKGINVQATFTGEFGHKVFVNKSEMVLPTARENVLSYWNDYWTPENPNASMPRPYRYDGFSNPQVSTFWMRNGNTLRMNTLSVNYALPNKLTQKVNIQKLKVYFTARNIWTIINPYDYKDPSVSEVYDYPMIKTYNLGIKLTI